MKNILTLALFFVGASLVAQTTSPSTTPPTTPTQATANPKAKALSKSWSLIMTENFGDQHKPSEVQKNDLLVLLDGGRYRMIMNGVAESGSWTLSKDNLWVTLTSSTSETKKFKVLESSETTLKIDYRDADDIHNILIYSVLAR